MNLLCIIYNFITIAHISYIGVDQHFKENSTHENELIFHISRNIDILEKVQYLERHTILDDNSKQIIDDYLNYSEIKRVNIIGGGLFSDWNFDINER